MSGEYVILTVDELEMLVHALVDLQVNEGMVKKRKFEESEIVKLRNKLHIKLKKPAQSAGSRGLFSNNPTTPVHRESGQRAQGEKLKKLRREPKEFVVRMLEALDRHGPMTAKELAEALASEGDD